MELQVETILKERGIGYRLIKLSQNAYTVDDVVKYSGGSVRPEEICKTIILRGKKSGKMAAILLRGKDKISFPKVKKILGEEIGVADGEQVKEAAGVEPGAVCPFLVNVRLLVDAGVMDSERINCGSGHHLYGLEFKAEDLAKAVDCEFVSLVKSVE
jgi:prolyl-tRNA editing enzyme YbaK/EbsC (Cys-tRNA(Pro) deacylase)